MIPVPVQSTFQKIYMEIKGFLLMASHQGFSLPTMKVTLSYFNTLVVDSLSIILVYLPFNLRCQWQVWNM